MKLPTITQMPADAPSRKFPPSSKDVSDVSLLNELGIVPLIFIVIVGGSFSCPAKFMACSPVSRPMASGIVPLILFPAKIMERSDVSLLMQLGIVPLIKLLLKSMLFSPVSSLMLSGMVPLIGGA